MRRLLTVGSTIVLLSGHAFADGTNYNDKASGNWTATSTWNPAGVPGSNDTAVIDSHTVTVNSTTDPNASTDVRTGGTLYALAGTISGPFSFSGGSLTFQGSSYLATTVTLNAAATWSGNWGLFVNGPIAGTGRVYVSWGWSRQGQLNAACPGWSGGMTMTDGLVDAHKLGCLGTGEAILSGGWMQQTINNLDQDITLNGGKYTDSNNNHTKGKFTLTADSTLGCHYGSYGYFDGQIVGNYKVTVNGGNNTAEFTCPSNTFNGLNLIYSLIITKNGAQGTGTITVASTSTNANNGATLTLDATPDQDWSLTNAIASGYGTTNAATNSTITVEGGAKMLTVCGCPVAPGGTNIGVLTVNGKFRLAAGDGTTATLAIGANGPNPYTGGNAANAYSQLRVTGSVVDFGGQNLQVTLGYAPSVLDKLYIVLNGGTNAVSNTFAGLPEGATFSLGSFNGTNYNAQISYTGNGDGGATNNDVVLQNIVPPGVGLPPIIAVGTPSNVTLSGAALCGTLLSTGSAATAVAVYWGTNDMGSTRAGWDYTNDLGTYTGTSLPATLSTNVSFATSNAFYTYRFLANNASGDPSGDAWSGPTNFMAGLVWWSNTTASAAEAGPVPGTVTVLRASLLTNLAIAVSYTVGGTATSGVDYATLPGTVTIPAGAASASVVIAPYFDAVTEPDKTVVLTLVAGACAAGSPGVATVTIADAGTPTNVFVGPANGNWNVGANWSLGIAPGSASEVGLIPTNKTANATSDLGSAGNRPTIQIDPGGTLYLITTTTACGLTLNGGRLTYGGTSVLATTVTVNADSTWSGDWELAVNGPMTGTGRVYASWGWNRASQLNAASPSWSGGITLNDGLVYAQQVGCLGTGQPILNGGWMLQTINNLDADITLNGGEYTDSNNSHTKGKFTLTADSTLGCHWPDGYFDGPIVGNGKVTINGGYDMTWFTCSSNTFNGLNLVNSLTLTKQGAQGTGTVNIASGGTLTLNATPDQDWSFTNDVTTGTNAATGAIAVEGGNNALIVCGHTLAPGGTNGVGMLTVNGRLRLAATGATPATLAIMANGTNVFTGSNASNSYSQVKVTGSLVDLGGQKLAVTLGYVPAASDRLCILLNGGTNAIVNTFVGLSEGGRVVCQATAGRLYSAVISYTNNADGGSTGNDVTLSGIVPVAGGSVFTVQ